VSGVVILDAGVFDSLKPREVRVRVKRAMRVRNMEIVPTDLNVFEAIKSKNPDARTEALARIREMTGTHRRPPLPTIMLYDIGAALTGDRSREARRSPFDAVLKHRRRPAASLAERSAEMLGNRAAKWDEANEKMQPVMAERLRETGDRDPWKSIGAFLRDEWPRPDRSLTMMGWLWSGYGLPMDVAPEMLVAHEAWRLYFDGLGASVYEPCAFCAS